MEITTKFGMGDRVYFWDGVMAKHGNVEEITIKVMPTNETKKITVKAKKPFEIDVPDLESGKPVIQYKIAYQVPGRIATKIFCERDLFPTKADLSLSAVFGCFAR